MVRCRDNRIFPCYGRCKPPPDDLLSVVPYWSCIGELIASALKNELKPFMKKKSCCWAFVALLPHCQTLQLTKDYSSVQQGEVLLEKKLKMQILD